MAITINVQNDAGNTPSANSYISEAYYTTWLEENGLTDSGSSEQRKARMLRAMKYLHGEYRGQWKGYVSGITQATAFPRLDLYNEEGLLIEGIPAVVKDAQATVTHLLIDKDLMPVLERGGRIQSKATGPLSRSYFPDAPSEDEYVEVDMLLSGITKNRNVIELNVVPS